MKKVPLWAKVPKAEYRELRNQLTLTCNVNNFELEDVWDMMIGRMEDRHTRLLKGKVKTDMTLAQAVENMQTQVRAERAARDEEDSNASKIAKLLRMGK